MSVDPFLKHSCFVGMVVSGLIALDTLLPTRSVEVLIQDKSVTQISSRGGQKRYSGIDCVVTTSNGGITLHRMDAARANIGEKWILGKSLLFGYGVTLANVQRTQKFRCINALFNYFALLPPIVFFVSLFGFKTSNSQRRREVGASSIALTFFTLIFAISEYYG